MNYKSFFLSATTALLAVSCGGNKTTDVSSDSDSTSVDSSVVSVPVDTEKTESIVAEVAPAETPEAEESKAPNNELDKKVDKILSDINQHISVIQDLKDNGFSSASSVAFRAIENLPDYEGELNKIKGQLTPEQKARIDAAEKKLNKLIESWN